MIAKVCVLAFFCAWCVQLSHQKPERCLKDPEAGPCMARIPRLYYNATTNSCREFVYGGCQGNDNNFETVSDCDGVCVTENTTVVTGDTCLLRPETGDCRASIPRMYYDTDSNSCKEFTYGGCGGNSNNFETPEQCQSACVRNTTYDAGRCFQKPEVGMCKARIPRLYYDSESNICQEFIYGGCGGNSNNFHSVQECDQACVSMSRQGTNKCYQPKLEGPCKMNLNRLYYDPQERMCKQFVYGGCGGNENNFEDIEACTSACAQQASDNICDLNADKGECRAIMFRFYYNSTMEKCGEFIYGGCGGNKNNFETLDDCKSSCDNAAPTTAATSFYTLIMCLTVISTWLWV